jgi:cytidine deaminase
MTTPDDDAQGQEESELVLGLVGPMGIGGGPLSTLLKEILAEIGYGSTVIHVIELLHQFKHWENLPEKPAESRYSEHIKAGNEFCKILERGDALSALAMGLIRKLRIEKTGDGFVPRRRYAYILRSLKRREEVETLRAVYGPAFLLVAAYSSRDRRVAALAEKLAETTGEFKTAPQRAAAEKLVQIDEKEIDAAFGQDVLSTYPLADVFVNASDPESLKESLRRFIRILFRDQSYTPTRDEFGMAHARIAALRSADLSRQVGASIATAEGTILATGTNEVPKAGGGLYWEGDNPDGRDIKLKKNTSYEMRRRVLGDALRRLAVMGWLTAKKAEKAERDLLKLTDEALQGLMKEARLMGAIEFGRIVHAEMSALLDAARHGVPTANSTLYSTTFPCHDCAHHIVAAGIKRVVYIDPYAKSLAPEMFADSIAFDSETIKESQIRFDPFVGISPDRYLDFFAMMSRKSSDGTIREWQPGGPPRIAGFPRSYTMAEGEEIDRLTKQIGEKRELELIEDNLVEAKEDL